MKKYLPKTSFLGMCYYVRNKANYKITGDVLKYILSQGISVLGSNIVNFTIIWYIVLKTSSSYILTITILCTYIPQALVSFYMSRVGDKYNKKYLIIIGDAITAFVTLLLYVELNNGQDYLAYIYITCILRSFGTGIQLPMSNSFLPHICSNDGLKKVNSLNSTIHSLVQLASPGIGGLILATVGFKGSLLIDVLTAVISILILKNIKFKHPGGNNKEVKCFRSGDMLNVWGYIIKKSSILNQLVRFYILFYFFISIPAFFTSILVKRVYSGSILELTLNETLWSVGTLLGGLFLFFAKDRDTKRYITNMKKSVIVFGLSIFLLGIPFNFIIYLLILFVSGMAMTMYSTLNNTIIQSTVPKNYIGRVFSVIQIITNIATPLGIIVLGVLSEYIGVSLVMSLSGLAIIVSLIFSGIEKE